MAGLEYLEKYESKATRDNYKSAVKDFLSFIRGHEIKDDLMSEAAAYFTASRDYRKDVDAFALKNKGAAPKTCRLKITAIRTYFIQNEVELPEKYWKEVKSHIRGNRALTIDRIPSNTELKKIINLMPIQGKALYLALSSSGIRIGECLQLKISDVDLTASPVKMNISGRMNEAGNSRIAFISSEAKEFMDQWLQLRVDYLKAAAAKSWKYGKSTEDDRIFPFDKATALSMWTLALEKAKLDKHDGTTGRLELHPHSLRKFFRTRLGAMISADVVECLMGHKESMSEVHRKHSIEDLAEFYKKGEHALAVMNNGAEVSKLKGEIEERSKALNEGMATLASKNADLENRLTALIADNQRMKEQLDGVIALVDKLSATVEKKA